MSNTNTSLHLAVQNGNIDIVKMLLDAGHDINAVNADGQTPLHIAVQMGHTEIVQLLTHTEVGDRVLPNAHGSLVPVNVPQNVVLDNVESSTNTNRHSRLVWGLCALLFIGISIFYIAENAALIPVLVIVALVIIAITGFSCFAHVASPSPDVKIPTRETEPKSTHGPTFINILLAVGILSSVALIAGTILDAVFDPITPPLTQSNKLQSKDFQGIEVKVAPRRDEHSLFQAQSVEENPEKPAIVPSTNGSSPNLRRRGPFHPFNPSIDLINRHGWVRSVLTMGILIAMLVAMGCAVQKWFHITLEGNGIYWILFILLILCGLILFVMNVFGIDVFFSPKPYGIAKDYTIRLPLAESLYLRCP
jgi:hypothetical protein